VGRLFYANKMLKDQAGLIVYRKKAADAFGFVSMRLILSYHSAVLIIMLQELLKTTFKQSNTNFVSRSRIKIKLHQKTLRGVVR
jgi:hypothetical protein